MRISDWSSDVCSSDLVEGLQANANILRFHDCSSRIPSDDAKEPKWPVPTPAGRPDRPLKFLKAASRANQPNRAARGPILLCDGRDNPCADRATAFANCEAQTLVHGDRGDQLDRQLDVVPQIGRAHV